ncbi:MAG: hypothetical protein CK533_08200 [Acidobacterium sp.]|nr:DUF4340 domain-containing protein [Acidobacteriota bacterium]PHY10709.1 MAG: hypothetical protein CK533_08200 [Acidobacterium sp.]
MRGLTSTIVLVLVLAGLGGYIYFVDSKRPEPGLGGDTATAKVYALEVDTINEVKLTYNGETSLLRKSDSGWAMVEPVQTEADPAEAISLVQALVNLELVRVLDENPGDLAPFGLAAPSIAVEFKGAGVSGSLKLGRKTPTQGEMYAQKNGEKAVFLVSSSQDSTFNRTPFNLRDKKILKFDREKADTLTLARAGQSMTLARTGSEWRVTGPVASRSDYTTVEGLLSQLSSANMSTLVTSDGKDLAKYGFDQPAMSVTLGAGSAKAVLEVGKTEGGQTYARDAARPLVFTVDTTLQDELNKGFDAFRKKELFELRAFYVTRLRAVLDAPGGPKTYELEKVRGEKPTDGESWKVTRVGGASHTADAAAMDDLLAKLVALKADTFVDTKTKTGLDKPALVVSASYDEGKFERVRFGQVGEEAFGSREGEAVVARIDKASMAAAMKAFDLVVMPPEPAPAPATTDKAGEKK